MNSLQAPPDFQYWYEQSGNISHWFYGVFEGGGAKGVAYEGALAAMEEKNCWFKAVAGASAGAITAALVAAGMSPKEIGAETKHALEKLKTGKWGGLLRLQRAEGYFPSDKLRELLDELLGKQLARKNDGPPAKDATFQQLYDATGIELNVVAADLSLNNQIIFSHHDTPNCAVADAVIASSSIPFAFASRLLEVADLKNGQAVSHHTVVDGGVWANFPMFIFEDRAFREHYERKPVEVEPRDILGFVLQECGETTRVQGEEIKFVREEEFKKDSDKIFIAREWVGDGKKARPSSRASNVGGWLLLPFYWLGRLVGRDDWRERGRWPSPKTKLAKHLVGSIDGMLGGTRPILFALVPIGMVAYAAWAFTNSLAADQLRAFTAMDLTDPMSYVGRLVSALLTATLIGISILVLFITLLGVVANYFLLRTSRRVLYGLVTTYVAGSGAPQWAGKKTNTVMLPMFPMEPEITTLSFGMEDKQRKALIELARQATLTKLEQVLSEEQSAGPTQSVV